MDVTQTAGVDWCAETMNALPIYSAERLTHVPLGGPYDLFWVGSLLTHMDEDLWPEIVMVLASLLAPRALLIVTTHGQRTRENMRWDSYGLDPCSTARLIAGWGSSGFGYEEYPGSPGSGYGVSLSTPEWVRTTLGHVTSLAEIGFWPAGWDHHQDVFAFQRVD